MGAAVNEFAKYVLFVVISCTFLLIILDLIRTLPALLQNEKL